MKKAVLVIAAKDFRDEEYLVPKRLLEEGGIEVLTASTTKNWAEGKLGARVQPDLLLTEVEPAEIDALVFVGGGGSSRYFDDPAAHALAQETASAGKVVAAICIAPVILARAGLLKGRKATVYLDGVEDLRQAGAVYTEQPVVTDGRVVTANGPEAAEAFGRELVTLLKTG